MPKSSLLEENLIPVNSMRFYNFPDIFIFSKIQSLKWFGNSWIHSYIPVLLLIITTSVSLVAKNNLVKHKKSLKILWPWLLWKFRLLFVSLITAPNVKNSHILAWKQLSFWKNTIEQAWKSSDTKFGRQWIGRKRSY